MTRYIGGAKRSVESPSRDRWDFCVQWEPRDLWVGAYWKISDHVDGGNDAVLSIYVCLIPCFPMIFRWRTGWRRVEE